MSDNGKLPSLENGKLNENGQEALPILHNHAINEGDDDFAPEDLAEARNFLAEIRDSASMFETMSLLQLNQYAIENKLTGLWDKNYEDFLEGFHSQGVYLKMTRRFLQFHLERTPEAVNALSTNLVEFFKYLLGKKDKNGDSQYCATSVRSFAAMIGKWYLYCGHGDLKKKIPLIDHLISIGEKKQITVKAKTFTQEQLSK